VLAAKRCSAPRRDFRYPRRSPSGVKGLACIPALIPVHEPFVVAVETVNDFNATRKIDDVHPARAAMLAAPGPLLVAVAATQEDSDGDKLELKSGGVIALCGL
jgi:hypothetical protein